VTRFGGTFLLGVGVVAAALAFGSRPLGVVGLGLVLAALAARVWVGLVRGPLAVAYAPEPATAVEGDRVRLRIDAERRSRVPVGSIVAHGRLGRLGAFERRLRGGGRASSGLVDLGRLPRGRFALTDTRVVLGDFLGLESVDARVTAPTTAIVVEPRIVELAALFSDAGRHGGDGRRLLLHRPAGFDFHSVREYEQGESLRRVHWPTTARRGQLMVKELEDAPRDAVVVLLDCDPAGAVGTPPDSSFDVAVRAAGSVLRAYAARGRKATLVTTGKEPSLVQVCSLQDDFRAALGALAAAEADALHGLAAALGRDSTPATRAGELVVVTSTRAPQGFDAVLGSGSRRLVSLVWVDAPSFAGRPTRAEPGVLKLAAAGVPVAVVRRGDDLAAALDRPREEALARA
jgi:uncharacterized protein (DUF58 family)